MSAICCSCRTKVCSPDTLWFAGTRYSPTINWLCGTCLDSIPEFQRIWIEAMLDFDICFGRVIADTGTGGAYQCTGSKQAGAEFKVDWRILRERLPGGEFFLNELYPYYCLEDYLRKVMNRRGYRELTVEHDRYRFLLAALGNTGNTLRSRLDITITGDGKTTKKTMPWFSLPANLPEETAREVLEKIAAHSELPFPKAA